MIFEVSKSAASRNLEAALVMLATFVPLAAAIWFLHGIMLKMSFAFGIAAIGVLGIIAAFTGVMALVFAFRSLECVLDVQEMSMHMQNAIVKKITAIEMRRQHEDKR